MTPWTTDEACVEARKAAWLAYSGGMPDMETRGNGPAMLQNLDAYARAVAVAVLTAANDCTRGHCGASEMLAELGGAE